MVISPPFLPACTGTDEEFLTAAILLPTDTAPGSGGAPLGSFPLTTALTWHNGLHIRAPTVGDDRLPVCAIADGVVIFRNSPTPVNSNPAHPQNYNPYEDEPAWTDNGMVIIRHTTELGGIRNVATLLTYYSVYMHLSSLQASVQLNHRISRKDVIGNAGSIVGRQGQLHFEICMDYLGLRCLLGSDRPTTWTDPGTAPSADGRQDAVFGSFYVYLPIGTPTSATKPTRHLGERATARRGPGQANDATANTLSYAQWVEVGYDRGSAKIKSFVATEDRQGQVPVGAAIGTEHVEPGFEYKLYTEACERHHSLSDQERAFSSPSGWYELLRFGRNLGDGTGVDPLPNNAAHWRQIPTATGTIWADLNAENSRKLSDADFPLFKGW